MGLPGRGGRGLRSSLCSSRGACALLGDTGTPWRRQGGCALFFGGAAPRVLWGCAHPDGHGAAQGGQNSEPLRNPNFLSWFVVLRRSPCPERGGFWARGYPPCFGVHTPFWGTHSILGHPLHFGVRTLLWGTPPSLGHPCCGWGGSPLLWGRTHLTSMGLNPHPPGGAATAGGGPIGLGGAPTTQAGGATPGRCFPEPWGANTLLHPQCWGGGALPEGGAHCRGSPCITPPGGGTAQSEGDPNKWGGGGVHGGGQQGRCASPPPRGGGCTEGVRGGGVHPRERTRGGRGPPGAPPRLP